MHCTKMVQLVSLGQESCLLAAQKAAEFLRARVVAGENTSERGGAHVVDEHLPEHIAEVGGERQIAALEKLLALQPRPPAI